MTAQSPLKKTVGGKINKSERSVDFAFETKRGEGGWGVKLVSAVLFDSPMTLKMGQDHQTGMSEGNLRAFHQFN